MQKYQRQFGFTLIELIIVIVLLGILAAGSSNMLYAGFNSFITEKSILNANWQASSTLERMTRDLRAVRSKGDILSATATNFKFINLDGETIEYNFSSTEIKRTRSTATAAGTARTLANNVTNLEFEYYNKDGEKLPSPVTADIEKICYIGITLSLTYNNITFTTTTASYLWTITA